jgi:toxin YoeB
MLLCWADEAWDDYLYWQQTDKKALKRVNELIKDIKRNPFE